MKYLILIALFVTTPAMAQQELTAYFDTNADIPTAGSRQDIKRWISQNSDAVVIAISGYADYRGTDIYNMGLSERRAKNVLQLLEGNGAMLLDSVIVTGRGEVANAKSLFQNRRVVITYRKSKVNRNVGLGNKKQIHDGEEARMFENDMAIAKVGDKIEVPGLNFYNNSDIVLQRSEPILYKLLAIIKANPKLKIQVQGHICCMPTDDGAIAHKRALAIYNFLVKNGIQATRLSYTDFGSTKPIYPLPEKNADEREANRRVEIEIVEN